MRENREDGGWGEDGACVERIEGSVLYEEAISLWRESARAGKVVRINKFIHPSRRGRVCWTEEREEDAPGDERNGSMNKPICFL